VSTSSITMMSLPPGAPAARPGGERGPLRNGNPRGDPNSAPRCGARTRSGSPCRAPAMKNGRCRMHGGGCTGPRTAEGMARMTAANTKHGMYAAAGAPRRATQVYVRTLLERMRLLCAAVRLRGHLPPGMAARLALGPEELKAPMHPSQVAFLKLHAAKTYNLRNGGAGGQRSGGTGPAATPQSGRAVADGIGVALRCRAIERAAARAEVNARAPWKAAVAFARAAKRAARAGSGKIRGVRSDAIQREIAFRAAGLRGACPSPGSQGRRNPDPISVAQTREGRERCTSSGVRSDAIQSLPPGVCPGGEPGVPLRLMRLTPTGASAPRSTTLACTWMPRVKAPRAGGFRRTTPPGSHAPQVSPVGVSPMLRAGCVQQFHAEPATGQLTRR
jgi:hypothetical protein